MAEGGKVYIGQTWLKVRGRSDVDLSLCPVREIHYRKPDGTTGEWEAGLESDNITLIYQIANESVLDVAGTWTIWGYFVNDSGKKGYTAPAFFEVYQHGY